MLIAPGLPFWALVAAVLFLASLPYWLPSVVLALRMRIFARINGDEGLAIPGTMVDASKLKKIYSSPAADGRSRGAALSDLFWYWLSPGPEMHQEHIEPGDAYEQIALTTRHILAVPSQWATDLTGECLSRVLLDQDFSTARLVRLRDLMMPVWAEFYYQLVFQAPCPRLARNLIVQNANDVVTALKCCSLRHMERRHSLTRYLVDQLEQDKLPHRLPENLSTEQKALYLQGVFFNTAIVQTSEAMAHLLMVFAQHQDIQDRLASHPEDDRYVDHVIAETLRMYPLFGVSHRITSADIAVDDHQSIPKGSVLCFNHPEYHRVGFDHPDRFDPDRWQGLAVRDANYIPFGVAGNRPCPAQNLAGITMRAAATSLVTRFRFLTSASHTRSLPNRGPCVVVLRSSRLSAGLRLALLTFMRIRDRAEDVRRSVVQLGLGTYMVWDARRLGLCERYFADLESSAASRARSGYEPRKSRG